MNFFSLSNENHLSKFKSASPKQLFRPIAKKVLSQTSRENLDPAFSPTPLPYRRKSGTYATPPASPAAYRILAFDSPAGEFKAGRSGGMEGDEHHRRPYEQPSYPRGYAPDLRAGSAGNIPDALDPRARPGEHVSERLRQSQMIAARTPSAASIAPSGGTPQDLGGYGYPAAQQYATPQMQGTSLQYSPDYHPDAQRQQSQFPHYTSQIMYNVSPPTQQSPYDAVPQYQPRQTAALGVLSTQFGVPPYYTAETTSAPVPASIAHHYTPTQFHPPLQYQPQASIAQSAIPATYTASMAEFAPPSAPEIVEQHDQDESSLDRLHGEYQEEIKRTFENIRAGRLAEAGRSLLEISDWLLGHASDLGLLRDSTDLQEGRMKLWDEFNTCWLALLQHQKDDTQKLLDTGQPPNPPPNLLQADFLVRMGDELVRLCDSMEKHGLVDYQMGVWEEEIVSILTQCLDLLDADEENTPEPEARTEPDRPVPSASR